MQMENPFDKPELAEALPEPKGCKLLVMVPKLKDRTSAGVILTKQFLDREEGGTVLAKVVRMAPDAFKGHDPAPAEPYCKVGDWIIMRAYNGTRIELEGWDHEFRLINDNTVEATIKDPTAIKRFGSIVTMRKEAV